MAGPADKILLGGVAGFGNVGRTLSRFLREHRAGAARLVAAFDPAPSARRAAAAEHGLAATGSLEELLGLKLDFIVIASTSAAHTDQVVAAAAAGCHVFCEKPIALNLPDADRAIAAVERAGGR